GRRGRRATTAVAEGIVERSEREDGGRDRDRDRDRDWDDGGAGSGAAAGYGMESDGIVRGRKSAPSPYRGVLIKTDAGDQEEEVVHSPGVVKMGSGGDVMQYLRTVAEVQSQLASNMQKIHNSFSRDGQVMADLVRSIRFRAAEHQCETLKQIEDLTKTLLQNSNRLTSLENKITQMTSVFTDSQWIKSWVRTRGRWLFRLVATGVAIWMISGLMMMRMLWRARRRLVEGGKGV
ncbi:hypothetical protein HK097_004828, partial [Rhizophlyctis rosea]